jgi:hypothetical protein
MLTETRPERGTPHPPQTLLQDGLVMSLSVRHDIHMQNHDLTKTISQLIFFSVLIGMTPAQKNGIAILAEQHQRERNSAVVGS